MWLAQPLNSFLTYYYYYYSTSTASTTTALDSRLWRRASRRRTRALRRCADAHPHRLCCFARTGHIMADAHVFWQLDGSIRVMVYTLVVAHVGALVCSTTTNPSPPIGHATPTGGRYSGACPSARGRRPMQRSRDDTGGSRWRRAREPGLHLANAAVTHGRSRTVLAMASACLRLRVCLVSCVQTTALYRCEDGYLATSYSL